MKKLLPVLLALGMAFHSFAQQPPVGSNVPDIKLPDVNGKKISLSSLKGKVVVLDFWASWCGPCRRGIPAIKEIYQKYKDKGLEVFAVSLDTQKKDWLDAIKADETTWMHAIDQDNKVATRWKVEYIPNTFLIDKTGKIVSVNANDAALEQQIAALLN